jgi:prepilin-type N-terminal cleavage/methylation domain-containing protein
MQISPARSKDAGLTMLELLVVLAILSSVVAVAASRIGPQAPPSDQASTRIEQLIEATRLAAIRSGQADVLVFEPGTARSSAGEVNWDGDTEVVPGSLDARTPSGRVVLYPDGSASGPAVTIMAAGTENLVNLVPRIAPAP